MGKIVPEGARVTAAACTGTGTGTGTTSSVAVLIVSVIGMVVVVGPAGATGLADPSPMRNISLPVKYFMHSHVQMMLPK